MSRRPAAMAEALRDLQKRFTAHIRDPAHEPAPEDVEDRRMAIYRDLFFRNLGNLIAKSFPVLRRLYDDAGWAALMRDFYAAHQCQTPLFPEVPREFLQYLQDERGEGEDDPPFLHELAHYEWVEIALDLDERELDDCPTDPDGDLLQGVPVFSPLAWPLAYRFGVHRIGPRFRPEEAPEEPTHLLVYRNRSDRVKFMQLNALSAHVVRCLKENHTQPGLTVLRTACQAIDHPRPETLIDAATRLLLDLAERDVILGTQEP